MEDGKRRSGPADPAWNNRRKGRETPRSQSSSFPEKNPKKKSMIGGRAISALTEKRERWGEKTWPLNPIHI